MSLTQSTYTGFVTCDQWLCAECDRPRIDHVNPTLFEFTNGPDGVSLKLLPSAQPLTLSDPSHIYFTRRKYRFVGMLRIHNESRWIGEVLTAALPLCEHIFILDDHSTDDTISICKSVSSSKITVFESPFIGLDEARDKNYLTDRIIEYCRPEWILCIDGDEVLEKHGSEIIQEHIYTTRSAFHSDDDPNSTRSYALKIEFLWNDPDTVRCDRIYSDFWRPSLFRPAHEDPHAPDTRTLCQTEFRFKSTPFGRAVTGDDKPNLHCSSVPQRYIHGFRRLPARLKHYGYMERRWRVGKLDYYNSIDWKNLAEDSYRHMTQGDDVAYSELPRVMKLVERGTLTMADVAFMADVPADLRCLHAGPIQLQPWNEDVPLSMSEWAKNVY